MRKYDGPLTKHKAADDWKQLVKERASRASRLVAPMPHASMPTQRRRMALLWFIGQQPNERLDVAWKYQPPITPDMRWLLQRGLLSSSRAQVFIGRRQTTLALTDNGHLALARSSISAADKVWIVIANDNNALP